LPIWPKLSFYLFPVSVFIHNPSPDRHLSSASINPNQVFPVILRLAFIERLNPNPTVITDEHTFSIRFVDT
jgi:hypothetical protein